MMLLGKEPVKKIDALNLKVEVQRAEMKMHMPLAMTARVAWI
jgi:hypothetical protein